MARAPGDGGGLRALFEEIERAQRLPATEVQRRQFAQLGRLAEHAAGASPHFRVRLDGAGLDAADLAHADGLRRLAPLTRRDIQSAGDALFCRQVPKGHLPLATTQTSGATGEPVVVRRSAPTRAVWAAMTLRQHAWFGHDHAGRFASIRATVDRVVELEDWGPPANRLHRTGPALGLPVGLDTGEMLDRLDAFRPNLLLVMPTTLADFVRSWRAGRAVPVGLTHVETTGETVPDELRRGLAEVAGLRIDDTYSSQEVGNIAMQCPESGLYHVMAEAVMVEVVDESGRPCGDGEVGRVVVTDLLNFATPLIRYDIGDYAEVGPACPCGRGSPTLRRIVGRERNMVVKPDGSRHWPMVGFHRFRDIAPIRQYQMIQQTTTGIEVRLVAPRPLTAAEEAELAELIRASLGHPFELAFRYFDDELPRGPGGKFEEFLREF